MAGPSGLPFQPSLFGAPAPAFDGSYADLRRLALDAASWVEHAEGWVRGADELFRTVLGSRSWGSARGGCTPAACWSRG